ncbi:hypothetical protein, partial [Schinkia azotoformans]|uniref:hypothetical protein n=1 Tax=Schinkia azotoformans TaxID=1454 RepID=UPI002E21E2C2|nr:hypothetical protein [Schinkia azotoformans]
GQLPFFSNISQTMENKFRQILGLIKIASENDGYKIKKSPPKSVPKLPTNRVINNSLRVAGRWSWTIITTLPKGGLH